MACIYKKKNMTCFLIKLFLYQNYYWKISPFDSRFAWWHSISKRSLSCTNYMYSSSHWIININKLAWSNLIHFFLLCGLDNNIYFRNAGSSEDYLWFCQPICIILMCCLYLAKNNIFICTCLHEQTIFLQKHLKGKTEYITIKQVQRHTMTK